MSLKTKSAKGVVVDFDLLRIQSQLSSTPKPTSVAARETLIDKKLRRRTRKTVQQLTATPDVQPQDQEQAPEQEDSQ